MCYQQPTTTKKSLRVAVFFITAVGYYRHLAELPVKPPSCLSLVHLKKNHSSVSQTFLFLWLPKLHHGQHECRNSQSCRLKTRTYFEISTSPRLNQSGKVEAHYHFAAVVHSNIYPATLRIGKAAYPLKVFVVPRLLELYVLNLVGIYCCHLFFDYIVYLMTKGLNVCKYTVFSSFHQTIIQHSIKTKRQRPSFAAARTPTFSTWSSRRCNMHQ